MAGEPDTSLAYNTSSLARRSGFSMMSGVGHVRVNPGYFADNYLRLIEYAAHLGVFPAITGDSKDAPPF
jgi:hypothetical protein